MSTYLAFWQKVLVRRDTIQSRRTFHINTSTYMALRRGVGCSPRGDAGWHATGGKYQSLSSGTRSMRVFPNERNMYLEINWRYAIFEKNTVFGHESRRHFVLFLSMLHIFTIRDKHYKFTFLDAFYISVEMTFSTKASSKRYQVVLQ